LGGCKIDEQGRVMDRELLNIMLNQGFDIHPYRLVEWDQVSLPDTLDGKTALWKAEHIPFKGWAVSTDDPLWKNHQTTPAAKTTALPLAVILSRSLFQQYFQCAAYEKALQDKLPHFQPTQPTSDPLYCLANQPLWLEVKMRRGRELLPFQIHWVPGRIPTMEELAFLFPISTFSALKEAKYSPQLKYYPEAQGESVHRIKTLILWQDEDDQNLRDNLANCLLAQNSEDTPKNLIIPKHPLPLTWVEECAERYQMPLQTTPEVLLKEPYLSIAEPVAGHRFRYNHDYLTVLCETPDDPCLPCEEIVPAWKKLTNQKHVTCHDTKAKADMLTMLGGYQYAFIYVKQRTLLFETFSGN
jgi:hypothetical protein